MQLLCPPRLRAARQRFTPERSAGRERRTARNLIARLRAKPDETTMALAVSRHRRYEDTVRAQLVNAVLSRTTSSCWACAGRRSRAFCAR